MVQSLQPWKPLNMTIKGQNPTILWHGFCAIFLNLRNNYGKKNYQYVDMDTAIQYFEGSQLIMMSCV